MGQELSILISFDFYHAHNKATEKYISGIIVMFGNNPSISIVWKSRRQGAVQTLMHRREFSAMRMSTEEAICYVP